MSWLLQRYPDEVAGLALPAPAVAEPKSPKKAAKAPRYPPRKRRSHSPQPAASSQWVPSRKPRSQPGSPSWRSARAGGSPRRQQSKSPRRYVSDWGARDSSGVHALVRRMFEAADADGSGAIEARELRGLLRKLGFDVSSDRAAEVLKAYDSDASKGLELAEFSNLANELRRSGGARLDSSMSRSVTTAWGAPAKGAVMRPLPTNTQRVGGSYVVLAESGAAGAAIHARRHPRRPHLKGRHDLAAKLEAAGLARYTRKLGEMGFDSVAQLLMLGRTGHALDEVVDALHPYPGHRVQLYVWLRNEAAAADAALRHEIRSLREAASIDQLEALKAELATTCAEARKLTERLAKVAPPAGPKTSPEVFLRRLLNARLSSAWNTWRERAAALAANALKLSTASRRIQNRPLSAAWNCWAGHWREARRQKQVASRVLKGWLNVRLNAAWNTWAERAKSKKEKRTAMRGVLLRATNASVLWAFTRIRECADERRALRRAVLWLFNQQLAFAFHRIRDEAKQRAHESQRMTNVISKAVNKELAYAWNVWKQLGGQRSRAKGVVARIRNKDLTWGLVTWKANAAQRAEYVQGLRKLITRLMNRGLARAWAQWEGVWRSYRTVSTALHRLANRKLYGAWRKWEGKTQTMSKIRSAWMRVGKLIVWKCLQAWRRYRRSNLFVFRYYLQLLAYQMRLLGRDLRRLRVRTAHGVYHTGRLAKRNASTVLFGTPDDALVEEVRERRRKIRELRAQIEDMRRDHADKVLDDPKKGGLVGNYRRATQPCVRRSRSRSKSPQAERTNRRRSADMGTRARLKKKKQSATIRPE